jgi:hypothetical protein
VHTDINASCSSVKLIFTIKTSLSFSSKPCFEALGLSTVKVKHLLFSFLALVSYHPFLINFLCIFILLFFFPLTNIARFSSAPRIFYSAASDINFTLFVKLEYTVVLIPGMSPEDSEYKWL